MFPSTICVAVKYMTLVKSHFRAVPGLRASTPKSVPTSIADRRFGTDITNSTKVGIKVESKMSMLAGVDINPHRGNSYTREKGILAKKAMNEAWSDHVKSKCIIIITHPQPRPY